MTDYTVARAKHATLASNAADKVTFTANPGQVEVLNRGTSPIYFTVTGVTPTIAGDDTSVAIPGGSVIVPLTATDVVQLIAAATTDYSATAL